MDSDSDDSFVPCWDDDDPQSVDASGERPITSGHSSQSPVPQQCATPPEVSLDGSVPPRAESSECIDGVHRHSSFETATGDLEPDSSVRSLVCTTTATCARSAFSSSKRSCMQIPSSDEENSDNEPQNQWRGPLGVPAMSSHAIPVPTTPPPAQWCPAPITPPPGLCLSDAYDTVDPRFQKRNWHGHPSQTRSNAYGWCANAYDTVVGRNFNPKKRTFATKPNDRAKKQRNDDDEVLTAEQLEHRRQVRKAQISKWKAMDVYKAYTALIPKELRTMYDPVSPQPDSDLSKRKWKHLEEKWRRDVNDRVGRQNSSVALKERTRAPCSSGHPIVGSAVQWSNGA